jgi:hypothetical protein
LASCSSSGERCNSCLLLSELISDVELISDLSKELRILSIGTEIDCELLGGDIEIDWNGGEVDCELLGGDIEIDWNGGEIDCELLGGDIEID